MTPKPLIYALDDHDGWGRELFTESIRRGWDGNLFNRAGQVNGATHVFMCFESCQKDMARQKLMMRELIASGHRLIPDWETCLVHKNQEEQLRLYKEWMPKTWYFTSAEMAWTALEKLPLPLVSKNRMGSSARLLHTPEEARSEITQVFGTGLACHHRNGERFQKGYVLWQEFIPANTYDYRIVATGRMRMMLRRHHQVGSPVRVEPIEIMNDEVAALMAAANEFIFQRKLHWAVLDMIKDPKEGWRLIDVNLSWKKRDHYECRYFNADGAAQEYTGADVWRLFCDEVEEGVFDH